MNRNVKLLRRCFAAVFTLLLLLSLIPTALAVPTSKNNGVYAPTEEEIFMSDPDAGWVDLKATVPGGFSGSVSVAIKNKETGASYIITAFHVNYYTNSQKVPYGEYTIERAYTSENSFVYEAFVEEDSFVLENSHTINVTVTYNEAGEAYLNGDSQVDSNVSSDSSSEISSDSSAPDTSSSDTQSSDVSDPDKTSDPTSDAAEQENTPADEPESMGSTITYILKVLIGTVVFVCIVFGTVYFVRKKQGL